LSAFNSLRVILATKTSYLEAQMGNACPAPPYGQ
jgi:hypothetical protein